MLLFGSRETSDAWADALKLWWLQVRAGLGHVKLIFYSCASIIDVSPFVMDRESPRSDKHSATSNV
jgi:hypothetical protein